MKKIWIVLANSSKLKIFEALKTEEKQVAIRLAEEHTHLEGHLKTSELMSDERGHYQTNHMARGAYEKRTSPKETEAQHFAYAISLMLEKGYDEHCYQSLIIAAPPHFLGLLKKALPKKLIAKIAHELNKEYTELPLKDIEKLFIPLCKLLLAKSELGLNG